MAHSTVRIAAGAGVVAASLLIVGPNPAPAVADKPGSGHSNNDYRKNGSGGQGGNAKRAASNFVRDVVNGISSIAGIDRNSKPNLDPPHDGSRHGRRRYPAAFRRWRAWPPKARSAMRSAAIAEAPVGDNVTAAAARGAADPATRVSPSAAFHAPNVTFGNGRTPGTHVAQPAEAPEAVLMQDALGCARRRYPPCPRCPRRSRSTSPFRRHCRRSNGSDPPSWSCGSSAPARPSR